MVKAVTVFTHGGIKNALSGVAKRRMTHVMHEGQRLDEVFIELQLGGNRPRNLCNFNRVGKAVAKMVRVAAGKDLRFIFQSAEGPRVDYAITVTLKIVAIRMPRLRIPPSPAFLS